MIYFDGPLGEFFVISGLPERRFSAHPVCSGDLPDKARDLLSSQEVLIQGLVPDDNMSDPQALMVPSLSSSPMVSLAPPAVTKNHEPFPRRSLTQRTSSLGSCPGFFSWDWMPSFYIFYFFFLDKHSGIHPSCLLDGISVVYTTRVGDKLS
ncbi:hypothetical protein DSO57_1018201 [Entomophthora muscae]|uniref:Uncharacterized protein n=1 Tax=Entomophthora muscae TaxID=34485 RepID=A0ACC2S680_9FUNG|nr:hypothetical protein DSO57_1018201 [Entomophthora muscae]